MKTRAAVHQPEAPKGTASDTHITVGASVAGFGPIHKKVRFRTEASALKGFGLLLRSGGAETLGENVYGLSSPRQIRLLEKHKVPFEVIE